jgi:tetratricopeptide (TPR) repeat protein
MTGREDIFKNAMKTGHSHAWDQQWEKAAAAYQQALQEFPNHPKALSSLGLALFELQRYEESLQAYQQAARVTPNDPVPLEKVGQLMERLGNLKEAVRSYLQVADLYVQNKDVEKALANWVRVTQLDSEHIPARTYLAMVHERLGHADQAAGEYLKVASLLQRSGNAEKAAEMIGRALRLVPNNAEARQAQSMLKAGKLLPKPIRPQGGTGPLRMAQVKQLETTSNAEANLDPISEARGTALTRLAEILFDYTESREARQKEKRGMQAIVRGAGEADEKQNEHARILLYIGQAIDAQTRNQEAQAAEELEKAISTGLVDPALYFDLGLLRSGTEQLESAMRNLQTAVKHADYTLASRLLMGQILRQAGRLGEAVGEYMEALKFADSAVVPPEQADALRQLYEPLIETHIHQTDQAVMEQLCDNIKHLLLRPGWRANLLQAREQLPKSAEGTPLMPLAEILAQAESSKVIESMGKVRLLASAGHLRSAMDEAFDAFQYAPTYLPLHTLIGDLLIQEGRTQDAIAKYTAVAEAYSVRGEATQAVTLLRRIVQVAPMDLTVRNHLIDHLASRGMVEEAIHEYIGLADIYYRQAELDLARKTYTTALQLVQQSGADHGWSVKLMRRMADIDMQRLDLRQALRIFEQIRTFEPDDVATRRSLVDLNLRLSLMPQAAAELENYLSHLQSTGRRDEAIVFLEELAEEYPDQVLVRSALAEEYRHANRMPEAVSQLETLTQLLLKVGDREGAIHNTEMIIALDPPNLDEYKTILAQIKSGSKT